MGTWFSRTFSISDFPGHNLLAEGINVMNLNHKSSLLNDLKSCNDYVSGLDAAKNIDLNCMAILARFDMMTPLKSGQTLVNTIKNCETFILNCGHFFPAEKT